MAKEKLKVKEELLEPSVNIDAHISEEDYNKIKKELYRFADPNYLDHSSDKNKVLKVRNLSVGFLTHGKKINVIRNISLDVIKGETLAIVGESGSGKSVFTKTFTGMLEDNGFISSGEILFRNPKTNEFDDISKYKSNKDWQKIRGRRIATIFQDPMTSLNPLLTIGFQIAEVLQIHHGFNKKDAKEEAIKILERVQIPDARNRYNDYPYQYSGGMRQRVVIAIALACRPEILICDEPTTALDVTVQSQILQLIKDLQKEFGWTTIFITHDLGVVANVADRVAVMYGGQVVEYGTCDEVFYNPAHPYTWALLQSLPQLGSKEEPLHHIKGNPPTFLNEIVGEAFAPRNEFAMNIDFIIDPPMFKISDTHFAKTWILDPRAPKVKKPKVIRELKKRMEIASEELKREVNTE
ncbi:MAG: ABC transporter ATP-binding protein [Bacillota bacterium]|jgi:oligopeptide transport system ATP-binding protein|nr:ABC transporter ATP-binding protein [Bacillota bacterium]MDY0118033.1 ABC transporter ATP-binding protein [Bacilli bacterium]